jgi:hypothetical protein
MRYLNTGIILPGDSFLMGEESYEPKPTAVVDVHG